MQIINGSSMGLIKIALTDAYIYPFVNALSLRSVDEIL